MNKEILTPWVCTAASATCDYPLPLYC